MTEREQSDYFAHTLLRARDWQHRPQFDEVANWWRAGGRGVCALVGMGGAGKTAVAERFLRTLPDVLPEDPDVPKDRSLPGPHSTFVFSFYDAPNPEAFFGALQMWLERTPRVQPVLSISQILYLLQQTPGLVILDGLEKVQEDGSRGTFGRLVSPKLREFLDRLASGWLPELSVLITSRFPLADLRDARPQFFHKIPVEEIDVHTGIQLVRARGVHGTDVQLEPIVEQCGRHALTVDFAGGYIHEYAGGDPATPLHLGTAEELQAEVEQEPDDDRRAVLKQGRRFARIAERYRQAMLDSDEAALALLERICLFRLGVDCKTLAAIFTGRKAKQVSGKALAGLNADQLQKKLDWLVRMRIVEKAKGKNEKSESSFYSIHPAVRDGFLSGISRDAARASHEAVRQGLEVSLGSAPGENPSDPATLDLLEEIVHYTLQSGHVNEAWDFYCDRMGRGENLRWRLGAYERGERICRVFAGGQSPGQLGESLRDPQMPVSQRPPYVQLPEDTQAIFINEWALYLKDLGRLTTAARCYELATEMVMRQESWKNASQGNRNLCVVRGLIGWLSGKGNAALAVSGEALRLAELADDKGGRCYSHASRAHALALLGEVPAALGDFRDAHDWQHKAEGADYPLFGPRGIQHTHLLARLGRREEATRLTEVNQEILTKHFGTDHQDTPGCQLILSLLDVERGELSSAGSLWASSRSWAEARDAKEVLCWSALVKARIELAAISRQQSVQKEDHADPLSAAAAAIEEGLKIARDCGYGLYHIDLLLERARLHLLRGHATAALDDIRLALDTGIAANEETGQPELLAANHEACGYAWPIPAGLQLRAEAQLLQAAQEVVSVGWAVPTDGSLKAINVDAVCTAHPTIGQLIDEARINLNAAMDRWQPLHDPEPERPDQNFKRNGKEYNYRAAATWQILEDLKGGILTPYPLEPPSLPAVSEQQRAEADLQEDTAPTFDVFLSHNSSDKPAVRNLKQQLLGYQLKVWFDEDELRPGIPWQQRLEDGIKTSGSIAVLIGKDGLGPWEDEEMQAALTLAVNDKRPVIPVLMPGAPSKPVLPMFLGNRTWVDMRAGLTSDALDNLVWGVTGNKPNS